MTRILFRVDAGNNVGLGHLQRCLSLASTLARNGLVCEFLSSGEFEVQKRISDSGFDSHILQDEHLGSNAECAQVIRIASQRNCEMIVVDSYHVRGAYLQSLRDSGPVLVSIDDSAKFASPAHLIINGSVHAKSLSYTSIYPETELLLGPEFSMLREEFFDIELKQSTDVVTQVLVTMGGADGSNLTPIIIKLLDGISGDFHVTVVVGPFFRNVSNVYESAEQSSRNVHLIREPVNLKDLMTKADIAISAGGQTLYELAVTGTPAIAIRVADNQIAQMAEFGRVGTIIPLVFTDLPQLNSDLYDVVNQMLLSKDNRLLMSKSGQDLIDGKGTLRCATAIQEMCKTNNS